MREFNANTPTFLRVDERTLRENLDKYLRIIYSAHQSLNSNTIQPATLDGGFNVAHGTETVTGSKTIATGLAQVGNVVASIDNGAVATNFTVTARPSPSALGSIDLYVWMPTAVADTTPIPATTAISVRWWATGSTTNPQESGS